MSEHQVLILVLILNIVVVIYDDWRGHVWVSLNFSRHLVRVKSVLIRGLNHISELFLNLDVY